MQVVRYESGEIHEALLDIADVSNEAMANSEAKSLANEVDSYQFFISSVVWYDILNTICVTSNLLQSKNFDIFKAIKCLERNLSYFKKYRETGFQGALVSAKELAE